MGSVYDKTAPSRAVRLNINSDLLNIAKKQKINLSKMLEKMLIDTISNKIDKDKQKSKKFKEVKEKLKEQKKRQLKERDESIRNECRILKEERAKQEREPKQSNSELVSKNIYSLEEKNIIMDRLNKERLIQQKLKEDELVGSSGYTKNEKEKILKKLNQERLDRQKQQKISDKRTYKKEIYELIGRDFYKFENMDRGYFIELEDMKGLSERPTIVTLYYRVFEEMHKKDMLLKIDTLMDDRVLISHDVIRVYFKSYALEDER